MSGNRKRNTVLGVTYSVLLVVVSFVASRLMAWLRLLTQNQSSRSIDIAFFNFIQPCSRAGVIERVETRSSKCKRPNARLLPELLHGSWKQPSFAHFTGMREIWPPTTSLSDNL